MPPRAKILPQTMQEGYRNSQVEERSSGSWGTGTWAVHETTCTLLFERHHTPAHILYNADAAMLCPPPAYSGPLQMLKYGFLRVGSEVTTIAGAAMTYYAGAWYLGKWRGGIHSWCAPPRLGRSLHDGICRRPGLELEVQIWA